jgi:hypothetical protein
MNSLHAGLREIAVMISGVQKEHWVSHDFPLEVRRQPVRHHPFVAFNLYYHISFFLNPHIYWLLLSRPTMGLSYTQLFEMTNLTLWQAQVSCNDNW